MLEKVKYGEVEMPDEKLQSDLSPSNLPPFHQMPADAFEEMCCAILANEPDNVTADLYHRPRQAQYGIDIIGHRHDRTIYVISCKCYSNLTKGNLANWSEDFLKHWDDHWKEKSIRKFILAVSVDVKSRERKDEIEAERKRFAKIGIEYEVWPPRYMQEKLRHHPGLIAQFLGIEWVSRLCGIIEFSWERPKDLLKQRWSWCQKGNFEKATDFAERAVDNARAINDKKTLANALRCAARDLGDYLISRHLEGHEADRVLPRVAEHIKELETLDLPPGELALEQALFARLDKRPEDAQKYAKIAETEAGKPELAADALLVQLQAHWQLETPEVGLLLQLSVHDVLAKLEYGEAKLALAANWLRTLCKANKATSSDVDDYISQIKETIKIHASTVPRALLLVEELASEFGRTNDLSNVRFLLETALELVTGESDALRATNIALHISQILAELGEENEARKHMGIAEKWIDDLKSGAQKSDFWASRKATLLVMRSRIETLTASKIQKHEHERAIECRIAAYEAITNALKFVESNEAKLKGDVGPFIADVNLRAGFAADALGRYKKATNHFRNARTNQIMAEERFKELAMKAWIGEAESLLFAGEPVKSRALWEEIVANPLADERQQNNAKHNIRWIDEHVLEVKDWFDSPAGARIRNDVASEPEGLRNEIAKQVAPLVDWFSEFPSKGDTGHAYSELIDIWGRGGLSRIVAAIRADALNAICVDATSIDEISLMARVFCPLYDTVIVSWKGEVQPALGLVPIPDHLGPPGNFGGQGYIRTSDYIDGKEGWHAAMGWANFLPKEVSGFLGVEALPLIKSGRLVLLPAPLIGCTQRAVGWADNLFTDFLLGGVVKTASISPADTKDSNKVSRLLDLGAVSLPFMDAVSMSDLNRILDDSGDWLLPLRRAIHGSIGNNGLRFEHWDGLRPHISDVREAFRQLDQGWKKLCSRHTDQTDWNIAQMESSFSAIRRSGDRCGSDPVTEQLQAITSSNDDFGPWIPLWRMRRAGGQINWTGNFDNISTPPNQLARMQGFTSSVSQGWLYPGDGGPGMATGFAIGSD